MIWQCEDNNKSYWRYIEDNFDGSEEQFNEWVHEEYETEPWGTPEEMEMFSSEKEYYEYLDDMMDEQDRALEEAKFRMEMTGKHYTNKKIKKSKTKQKIKNTKRYGGWGTLYRLSRKNA